MKVPPRLLQAQAKYDEMEPPKRMMLLIIALLVLAMVWEYGLVQPHQQRELRLQASVAELRKTLPELSARVQRLSGIKVVDMNAERLLQIKGMEAEYQTLLATLGQEAGALIQPNEMLKALKRLLAERPEVTLRHLQASSVQPVQLNNPGPTGKDGAAKKDAAAKKEGAADASATSPTGEAAVPGIYRHDIELEIEASYLDLVSFFKEIESYPWVFFWNEVRYHAVDYPKTHAVIRLFTLSMGEGLVGG